LQYKKKNVPWERPEMYRAVRGTTHKIYTRLGLTASGHWMKINPTNPIPVSF
jgi:hypothetical protein